MQDSEDKTWMSWTLGDVREAMMRSGYISEWLCADQFIQKWWLQRAKQQPEPSSDQLELFSNEAMSGKPPIVVKAPLVALTSESRSPS